jgi:hypothetical protein
MFEKMQIVRALVIVTTDQLGACFVNLFWKLGETHLGNNGLRVGAFCFSLHGRESADMDPFSGIDPAAMPPAVPRSPRWLADSASKFCIGKCRRIRRPMPDAEFLCYALHSGLPVAAS